MRKVFIILVSIIILSIGSYFGYKEYSKSSGVVSKLKPFQVVENGCNLPLEYKIGDIDKQFGVSKERAKKEVKKAEEIWEKSFDQNLFQYSTSSDFKINFVYDERQLTTDQKENFKSNLDQTKSELEQIESRYQKLSEEYDKKMKKYEIESDIYQKKAKKYNEDVSKWNKKGGAPEKKYQELQKEKEELKKMESKLANMEKDLDTLTDRINDLANKSEKLVKKHNRKVETYREKFGEKRKFNAGDYKGSRINIYQFNTAADLRLKLAHELGHALGIGHIKGDSEAIMYAYMDEQNLDSLHLTEEDKKSLKRKCKLE